MSGKKTSIGRRFAAAGAALAALATGACVHDFTVAAVGKAITVVEARRGFRSRPHRVVGTVEQCRHCGEQRARLNPAPK